MATKDFTISEDTGHNAKADGKSAETLQEGKGESSKVKNAHAAGDGSYGRNDESLPEAGDGKTPSNDESY